MTAKKAQSGTGTGKRRSFEDAIERLEKIVQEMESGSLSLEDMITRFEEGQKLVGQCSKRLNEVERRIEVLMKKDDETQTAPFPPEEAEGDAGPASGDDELF